MSFTLRQMVAASLLGGAGIGWLAFRPPSGGPPTAPHYVLRLSGSLTFCRDIAPIVHQHCGPCHHEGASAPFALIEYSDCRKRAAQIADVVTRGLMPPWLPDSELVAYADQRVLTPDEIGMIAQWAAEGAPEGDPADLPPPPTWPDGWMLGEPDLVVEMPEPFVLPAEGTDVFRNFVIPIELDEPRYVRAVEIHPGNPQVVHHGVLLIDPTRESQRLDEQDPEPGYGGMIYGLTAHSPDGHFLGWTPGKTPFEAPPDMAWQLTPGADLVLQLHLLPSGKPESVRAKIALYFTESPPSRRPQMLRLGSLTIDIPPGQTDYRIADEFVLPVDVDVLGVYPHAHYLAREMKGIALLPDGSRRWLIHIPRWDFNWQDEYRFPTPIPLPRGTKLRMEFTYDNSSENVRNPHHPPRRVVWGPQSSDEMGDLWIQVVPHRPADRDRLRRAFAAKEFAARLEGAFHAIRVTPDGVEARYNLGCLLEQAGRLDEAETQFTHVLDVDPDHAPSLNNLGVLHCRRGRIFEAIPLFERALELSPDYADARANLAQARRILHRSQQP